jgi:hypothetical protein
MKMGKEVEKPKQCLSCGCVVVGLVVCFVILALVTTLSVLCLYQRPWLVKNVSKWLTRGQGQGRPADVYRITEHLTVDVSSYILAPLGEESGLSVNIKSKRKRDLGELALDDVTQWRPSPSHNINSSPPWPGAGSLKPTTEPSLDEMNDNREWNKRDNGYWITDSTTQAIFTTLPTTSTTAIPTTITASAELTTTVASTAATETVTAADTHSLDNVFALFSMYDTATGGSNAAIPTSQSPPSPINSVAKVTKAAVVGKPDPTLNDIGISPAGGLHISDLDTDENQGHLDSPAQVYYREGTSSQQQQPPRNRKQTTRNLIRKIKYLREKLKENRARTRLQADKGLPLSDVRQSTGNVFREFVTSDMDSEEMDDNYVTNRRASVSAYKSGRREIESKQKKDETESKYMGLLKKLSRMLLDNRQALTDEPQTEDNLGGPHSKAKKLPGTSSLRDAARVNEETEDTSSRLTNIEQLLHVLLLKAEVQSKTSSTSVAARQSLANTPAQSTLAYDPILSDLPIGLTDNAPLSPQSYLSHQLTSLHNVPVENLQQLGRGQLSDHSLLPRVKSTHLYSQGNFGNNQQAALSGTQQYDLYPWYNNVNNNNNNFANPLLGNSLLQQQLHASNINTMPTGSAIHNLFQYNPQSASLLTFREQSTLTPTTDEDKSVPNNNNNKENSENAEVSEEQTTPANDDSAQIEMPRKKNSKKSSTLKAGRRRIVKKSSDEDDVDLDSDYELNGQELLSIEGREGDDADKSSFENDMDSMKRHSLRSADDNFSSNRYFDQFQPITASNILLQTTTSNNAAAATVTTITAATAVTTASTATSQTEALGGYKSVLG